MKTPHITAIATAAGGTGKTALARALAAGLHDRGRRVLLIDMDSQGNATWLAKANTEPSVVDAMMTGNAKLAIQHTDHMDVIAGGEDLVGIDIKLTPHPHGVKALVAALAPVADQYDNIVIDCPPGANMAVYAAMTTADDILIPAPPAIKSVAGLSSMLEAVKQISKVNNGLTINGVLITRKSQPRSNLTRATVEGLANSCKQLGVELYNTQIREAVAQGEADLLRESIFVTAPASALVADYNAFIDEYITKENS